jgi:hypothetical protein
MTRRHAFAVIVAALVAAAGPALGQGAIQQAGPVVPGHAPVWWQNGILADGGTPSAPLFNALGLYGGTSCPFGISSQPSGGTYTSAFALFTICQTTTATTLTLAGIGQAAPSLYLNLGGVIYSFPGPGSGDVLGPSSAVSNNAVCFNGTSGTIIKDCGIPPANPDIFREVTSGTTDAASSSDVTIAWNSSSAATKTESLYACNSGVKGKQLYIKDEYGSAGTYPYTLAPNGADTIDTGSFYYLSANFQGVALQCNGSGNWIVK